MLDQSSSTTLVPGRASKYAVTITFEDRREIIKLSQWIFNMILPIRALRTSKAVNVYLCGVVTVDH